VRLKLLDWLAASYKGEAAELINEAVEAHIDQRLDNEPEMRKRFNAARAKRIAGGRPKVVPINVEPEN
jgi:hypothetical protein